MHPEKTSPASEGVVKSGSLEDSWKGVKTLLGGGGPCIIKSAVEPQQRSIMKKEAEGKKKGKARPEKMVRAGYFTRKKN